MIYNAPIIDRTLEPRVTQSLACAPAGSADVATDPLLWSTVFRPLSDANQANELHGYFSSEPQEVASPDHSNQQYSITAVTTSAGAIAERYAYSAYGEPTILDGSGSVIASSAINNRYSYTGREWDATVGLHHFRARWMSPKTGRFLTRDPIGYWDGLSLFSTYFVLIGTDPSGMYENGKGPKYVPIPPGSGPKGPKYLPIPPGSGPKPYPNIPRPEWPIHPNGTLFPPGHPFAPPENLPPSQFPTVTPANCAHGICAAITVDLVTPEPTDFCPPKYLCYVIVGCAAGAVIYCSDGDELDELQEALDAFRRNPDFRRWWHKEYKGDQGMSGGGKKNPDMCKDDILDGFKEWIDLGKPKGH